MNELIESIKADLSSRRLAPVLVALCVALLAAVAYVALSGKGQSPPATPVAVTPPSTGLPVTIAPPNATTAAAETPAGARYQTRDGVRDPFLAGAAGSSGTSAAGGGSPASGPTGSSGVAGNSGAAGNAGNSGTRSESAPIVPAKAETPSSPTGKPKGAPAPHPKKSSSPTARKPRPLSAYSVSVLFGAAPASPEQPAALTPYEDLLLYEPLPSAKTPLIVFTGVSGGDAVFALVVPPILRGPAVCLPSQGQCQSIRLAAGQSEELEYVKSDGSSSDFELQVVKVSRRGGGAAAAARARRQSKAGLWALGRAGLLTFG